MYITNLHVTCWYIVSFFTHLSWKLKWAFLITCRPSSVCPSVRMSVNFSHFHLLLQNHWANILYYCRQSCFWANIGPTTQNPPLVRSWSSDVGPTTVHQLLKLYCWANVSTQTMTCCQQLQPLPNAGQTIACYLGWYQWGVGGLKYGIVLWTDRNIHICTVC